jgi:hypothetical protein
MMVTPDPKLIVVLPFPAPLKVAVSPVPGTGVALQLASAQLASVAPVQVPLAAFKLDVPANKSRPMMVNIFFVFMGFFALWFKGIVVAYGSRIVIKTIARMTLFKRNPLDLKRLRLRKRQLERDNVSR